MFASCPDRPPSPTTKFIVYADHLYLNITGYVHKIASDSDAYRTVFLLEEVFTFSQGNSHSSDGHRDCMDDNFLGNSRGEISDGPLSDVNISRPNPGRVVSNGRLPGADKPIHMNERTVVGMPNIADKFENSSISETEETSIVQHNDIDTCVQTGGGMLAGYEALAGDRMLARDRALAGDGVPTGIGHWPWTGHWLGTGRWPGTRQ